MKTPDLDVFAKLFEGRFFGPFMDLSYLAKASIDAGGGVCDVA